MCVICHCVKPLERDEFDACFRSNKDGAGFGWHDAETGKNMYIKGFMDVDQAWEAYQNVPVPHIAHFRLASAGGVEALLTHPFIISPDSPLSLSWQGAEGMVFHNGTISDWKVMLFSLCSQLGHMPEGSMSDTRFVAMAMARMGEDALCFFTSSKFATIDRMGTITKYGSWEQDGDNWYTNSSYKRTAYSSSGLGVVVYGSGWDSYYQQGTMWKEDEKDRNFVPFSQRTCMNCRMYGGFKKKKHHCTEKGELKDLHKCAHWEGKRKRGRPRKNKKDDAKEIESGGTRPINQSNPIDSTFNKDSDDYRQSCMTCENYNGQYKCRLLTNVMTNLRGCPNWKKERGYDYYDGYFI